MSVIRSPANTASNLQEGIEGAISKQRDSVSALS
jgi:hypothetical protein